MARAISGSGSGGRRDQRRLQTVLLAVAWLFGCAPAPEVESPDSGFSIAETGEEIVISGPSLEARIRKQGYVSGVAGGSFLDRKTGFRDAGHGLHIADFLLEPGSADSGGDQLPEELRYLDDPLIHGVRPKRIVEGPQICTRARRLSPRLVEGPDFVAVTMDFTYTLAAPGKRPGSKWTQTIVFPAGARYFVSSDRIDSVNDSDSLFRRIDMPGHIKHREGDVFSEVYLSYFGEIPADEFLTDFGPDGSFNYRTDRNERPSRFIRAYRLRGPESGGDGPWLAGMTLDPDTVYEAWCHQRGYVCMIQELGGHPIRAGESFGAAYVVGYFDSIDEMNRVYDRYAGHRGLFVDRNRWRLTKRVPGREKEAEAPLVDALFGPNRSRTRHLKDPGGGG